MTRVAELFQEIRDDEYLIEDRREYERYDLKLMYDISDEEAEELYQLIQSEFSTGERNG